VVAPLPASRGYEHTMRRHCAASGIVDRRPAIEQRRGASKISRALPLFPDATTATARIHKAFAVRAMLWPPRRASLAGTLAGVPAPIDAPIHSRQIGELWMTFSANSLCCMLANSFAHVAELQQQHEVADIEFNGDLAPAWRRLRRASPPANSHLRNAGERLPTSDPRICARSAAPGPARHLQSAVSPRSHNRGRNKDGSNNADKLVRSTPRLLVKGGRPPRRLRQRR